MGQSPAATTLSQHRPPRAGETAVTDSNVTSVIDEMKHAPKSDPKAYGPNAMLEVISKVTPANPEIPSELQTALAAVYNETTVQRLKSGPAFEPDGAARWLWRDSIDFSDEAQMRLGQKRDDEGNLFYSLYMSNPLSLPPLVVVERPTTGEGAYKKGENGPYVGADGYRRDGVLTKIHEEIAKASDGKRGIYIAPCFVVKCPKGKNPIDHALFVASALNALGPDQIRDGVRRVNALKLLDAGYNGQQVAERLGVSDSNIYDWRNIKWVQGILLNAGVPADRIAPELPNAGKRAMMSKGVDDTALLQAYKVLAAPIHEADPEEADRVAHERLLACVNLAKAFKSSRDWSGPTGLRGDAWRTDHSIIHNIAVDGVLPKNPTGSKPGPAPQNGGGQTGLQGQPSASGSLAKANIQGRLRSIDDALESETDPNMIVVLEARKDAFTVALDEIPDAPASGGGSVDPFNAFGSAVVTFMHGEDQSAAELFTAALAAKITPDMIDGLVRGLGKVHAELVKHAKNTADREAEEAAKKDMATA